MTSAQFAIKTRRDVEKWQAKNGEGADSYDDEIEALLSQQSQCQQYSTIGQVLDFGIGIATRTKGGESGMLVRGRNRFFTSFTSTTFKVGPGVQPAARHGRGAVPGRRAGDARDAGGRGVRRHAMTRRKKDEETDGYVKMRKGIWPHVKRGWVDSEMFMAYSYMLHACDCATGVYHGSAAAIAAEFGNNWSVRKTERFLRQLRLGRYIDSKHHRGKTGNYDILINNFEPTKGPMKGKRLRQVETRFWKDAPESDDAGDGTFPVTDDKNGGAAGRSDDKSGDNGVVTQAEVTTKVTTEVTTKVTTPLATNQEELQEALAPLALQEAVKADEWMDGPKAPAARGAGASRGTDGGESSVWETEE